MGNGKRIIILLTAVFLALILVAMTQEEVAVTRELPLELEVLAGGQSETIRVWEHPEGGYYAFLPSYGQLDQIRLRLRENGSVYLDGVRVTDGMSMNGIQLQQACPLTYESGSETTETTLTVVQSGNVPSLYLDVASGSMEYLHMDKTHQESGELRLYDEEGRLLHQEPVAKVKGRGNTSWWAEKKPYNLTLSREADLLGMGAADRWILLSEGASSINIRNKIVRDFAEDFGFAYTPQCHSVDLYLNGEYAGLYLLIERNEIHPQRVDIPQEGSFLVSIETKGNMDDQKIPYIDFGVTQVFRIRESDLSDQALKEVFATLKNAIEAENGRDPATGKHWQEVIDLDSWAKKYMLEELFANPDGNSVSQYFYRSGSDPEGKIYAGPVWDYDYAMGGENYWMKNYPGFLTMNKKFELENAFHLMWLIELYESEAFQQRVKYFYQQALPLVEELIQGGVEAYAEELLPALVSNGLRWGYALEDIRAETADLTRVLKNHTDFLTDYWLQGTDYHVVRVDFKGRRKGYLAVRDGESLPPLPSDDESDGEKWCLAYTDGPFDITQPICEDVSIYIPAGESSLSKIQLAPGAALVSLLVGMLIWNRVRTKKEGHHEPADAA